MVAAKKSAPKVHLKNEMVPTNGGPPFPSKPVFVAELRKLRLLALQFLRHNVRRKKKPKYDEQEDIQWIVTVPAIWSDFAKNKVKQLG